MLRGSCLCGAVVFEIDRAEGPFELCHCRRCRKVSGSGYLGTFRVPAAAYRRVQGDDVVLHFALPVRDTPPPYAYDFCGRCGCALPGVGADAGVVEVPVGLMDDEIGIRPDRHIFVEHRPAWDRDLDALPDLTGDELRALRPGN